MKVFLLAVNFLLFLPVFNAQNHFAVAEKKLSILSDSFINSEETFKRLESVDSFNYLLEETLKKDSSFYYPFDSLKWVSKIISPDSTFRIFSWQVQGGNGLFDYYGYVQKKNGHVVKLNDNKQEFSDMEYGVFSNLDWYGQLYYNIISYKIDSLPEYMVFGYKLAKNEKIKIAEPLIFENDKIIFGKPVFEDTLREGLLKNRIVLWTSNTAASKLNYDPELGIIIYDHTINILVHHPDEIRILVVPDGSYHGYRLEGNKWSFINKVFDQVYNENMIPVRSQNKEKVDLISGKKINSK